MIKLNMLELRSLPGQVSDVHASQETVQFAWSPGDGYRYPIRVSYIAAGQAAAIGCAEEAKLVSIQIGQTWIGLCVGNSKVCTIDYIVEKLGKFFSPVQTYVFAVAVNVLLPQCDTSYGRKIDAEMREKFSGFKESK